MPPSIVFIDAVRAALAAIGLGDVVGDVGGERGLAHRRTAGEDDQVGRCRPPSLLSRSVRPVDAPDKMT